MGTLNMKISMGGCARNAMNDLKEIKELIEIVQNDEDIQELLDNRHNINWENMHTGQPEMAISILHDCLLATLTEKANIKETKEFLAVDDEKSRYFGDIIKFTEKEE